MDTKLDIYLISGVHSKRRSRAIEMLNSLELTYSIFDAIYYTNTDYTPLPVFFDVLETYIRISKVLSPSELGCLASHRGVMSTFISGNEKFALILEDDVVLCQSSIDSLRQLLSNTKLVEDFDVISLFTSYANVSTKDKAQINGLSAYLAKDNSSSAAAYVLTRKGALKILSKKTTGPADWPVPLDSLKFAILESPLAELLNAESSIDGMRSKEWYINNGGISRVGELPIRSFFIRIKGFFYHKITAIKRMDINKNLKIINHSQVEKDNLSTQ